MRYIELNPVRANMTSTPRQYRWSSFHRNGRGQKDEIVTPHDLYQRLGKNEEDRKIYYKAFFKAHIGDCELDDIRKAWQTGTPLGNGTFRQKIEDKLECTVGQSRRGRPSLKLDSGR